jgi:hypothetical protein
MRFRDGAHAVNEEASNRIQSTILQGEDCDRPFAAEARGLRLCCRPGLKCGNFFNFAVLKRIDVQFIVGRRDQRAIHTIFDGICSRTACLRWVVEVGDCHVFSTIK